MNQLRAKLHVKLAVQNSLNVRRCWQGKGCRVMGHGWPATGHDLHLK
jgi:hypothetical protein